MNPRVYLTIFRTFILRVFRREKMRVAVTVLGIALGVAVMVAMRLGNRTALDSFRQATESVAGAASVEIVGSADRAGYRSPGLGGTPAARPCPRRARTRRSPD